MRHKRHYTVDEANRARTWVTEAVSRINDALVIIRENEGEFEKLDPMLGGTYPGPDAACAVLNLAASTALLQDREVVLRDPENGVVDFPYMRGKEEAYLCWKVGETEISHWHDPDSGFSGRKPI